MSNLEEKDIVPKNDDIPDQIEEYSDNSELHLPDLIPADINNEAMEVEENKTSDDNEEKKELDPLDSIDEEDNSQDDSEQVNRELEENAAPGECPLGDECPIKIAMDNNISPDYVRHDPYIRSHVERYHRYLDFLFTREYNQIRSTLFLLYGSQNRNEDRNEDEENENSKCCRCDNYYDHQENSKFFMSCCDNTYCLKCIRELTEKDESCPSCKSNLEYLKDIKIPEKKIVAKDGTDCSICCNTMNTTQYNGKVTLDCNKNCKFEMCISCAYKSLQDTKYTKMGEVQGIEGLILPQNYTVKGACPNCRQIPKNKEELISLYEFLPPRH